ncbi:hypothetical protein R6Q59_005530 [Mikania micrantha]
MQVVQAFGYEHDAYRFGSGGCRGRYVHIVVTRAVVSDASTNQSDRVWEHL